MDNRKKQIAEVLSSALFLILLSVLYLENLEVKLCKQTYVGNELLLSRGQVYSMLSNVAYAMYAALLCNSYLVPSLIARSSRFSTLRSGGGSTGHNL